MQEIPDACSFSNPRKKGNLLKLTGRGWLYPGSWKKRYCVLDGTKFYYYENEKGRGSDKTSGVLNLDYYDVCEEFDVKDKRYPYVFIVDTSVRGFFNNRHQFAAESESEMQDWIRSVHDAINDARNTRSRAGRNRIGSDKVSPATHISPQMSHEGEELDTNEDHPTSQLVTATKDRVRGPQGRRLPQRKSMMPAGTPGDDGVIKQRSFSLSSPAEEDENASDSPKSNKRISLSMEIMDRGDNPDEALDAQRSSSSHELPSHRNTADHQVPEPKSPKKAIFGRLGGQHAALTKELELKLKSGLAPGGRRFPVQEPEEEEDSSSRLASEADRVDKKLENLQSKATSVQRVLDGLEQRLDELKEATSKENVLSAQNQIQEMVSQAATLLKEAEETNSKCKQALAEAEEARDEHRKLLHQCRDALAEMEAKLAHTKPRSVDHEDTFGASTNEASVSVSV